MSSAAISIAGSLELANHRSRPHILRDASQILNLQPELIQLGRSCARDGALDDLRYFLSWLEVRGKSPCLVALAHQAASGERLLPQAAVLLYEHRVSRVGIRIFSSFDSTGRRALVPPVLDTARFAQIVCGTLFESGAQCVQLSFRHEGEPITDLLRGSKLALRWAVRERAVPGYLQLKRTVDETMALIGSRTRNHLRYYRRRAEKELGCEFVAEARISREDFLALNRVSSYPSSDELAGWKYDALKLMKQPVLSGLRDRDGRWLSLVGGLRSSRNMEMFWQINRYDMKSFSLGTVMRSFLIEHELKRGSRRLYFEGGTSHSMSNSFVQERCTDLLVVRDNLVGRRIPELFQRYVHKENPINEMLATPGLVWRNSRGR